MNRSTLKEKCEILEKVILALSKIYNDPITTDNQKALLETIIGAAIWYLPSSDELWSGMISSDALEELKLGKKIPLTKEHKFPRKQAGRQLLSQFFSAAF